MGWTVKILPWLHHYLTQALPPVTSGSDVHRHPCVACVVCRLQVTCLVISSLCSLPVVWLLMVITRCWFPHLALPYPCLQPVVVVCHRIWTLVLCGGHLLVRYLIACYLLVFWALFLVYYWKAAGILDLTSYLTSTQVSRLPLIAHLTGRYRFPLTPRHLPTPLPLHFLF